MAKHIHIFLMLLLFSPIATLVHIRAQNTNLPVGSIPGTAGVSSLGAATYSIPIEVVPGTQGMQPALSISYNSTGGTGILGAQCFLSGLSSISRSGQTDFHDDNITPISLNYSDRFSIDGNRLVNSDTSLYGRNGTQYYKEFHDYSKIVSYGTAGNGPQYFKVFTDNGQVMEYGNSTDSRQTLGNGSTVLNWLLSKVTDLNGNYMTYTYGKSGNEIWINRIDYTGNVAAGLSPYARVVFEYDTGLHVGSDFVAGYEIRQTRLLRAISVLYDNGSGYELVRQYRFTYSSDYPKRLESVQLMVADSTMLNPTEFQWSSPIATGIDTLHNTTSSMSKYNNHFAVDIDKDGSCDFVEYNSYGWQVFLKIGSTYLLQHSEVSPNGYQLTHCIPADLDGDGVSEIIATFYDNTNQKAFVKATYYPFNSELLMDTLSSITNVYEPLSGDFLGEGTHQVVFRYNQNYAKLIGEYNSDAFLLGAASAYPADFDGDGIMELIVFSQPLSVFKYNKNAYQFNLIKSISLNNYCIASGDFNGDGICDILCRKADGRWSIALGTGDGLNDDIPMNVSLYHKCTHLNPVVVDINSDGFDDILTFVCSNDANMTVLPYASNGYYNDTLYFSDNNYWLTYPQVSSNTPDTFNYNFTFGDYNGDKNLDLIFFSNALMSCKMIFYKFGEVDRRKRIHQATDGSGAFAKWRYKYIDGMYYWYASNINITPYHFNVVDTIITSMGSLSDAHFLIYNFAQPTYSFKRKQMMGFLYTLVADLLYSKTVITHYRDMEDYLFLTGSKDFLVPYKQTRRVNNQQVSEQYFTSECMLLPIGPLMPRIVMDSTINYLDSVVTIKNNLYNVNGRPLSSRTDVHAIGESIFLSRENDCYHHKTLTLSNGATVTYVDSSYTENRMRGSNLATVSTTSVSYDNNGRLSTRSSTADGVTVSETVNAYDLFGNATSVTKAGTGCTNRTSTLMYENTGRFAIRHTNPKGHIFQKNHDPRTGLVLSETDENNLTTTYVYDVFGRLDSIRYPDNTYTSCSRHWYTGTSIPKARWYTLTKHTGKANTEEYFDLLGRTVCVVNNSYYTDTRYNLKGQVDQTSAPYSAGTPDADKTWHNYQYDAYGRMIHETASYKDLTYSYGTRNTTVTDNLRGTVSSKTLDAAGRLVQASDPGGIIQYAYTFDTYNGKAVFKTDVTTGGNTTSILADQRGNRVKISDPDAGIVTCTYNAFGKLASQTDARGVTTAMTYDVLGRVTGKTYSDSTGFLRTVLYTYDQHSSSNKGRGKLSYTTLNGTVSEIFLYDNVGRLSQKSKIIDSTLYSETYTYNTYGQTATLTYPDGYAVSFGYKTNGQIETVRQASNSKLLHKIYSYNKFGQPTRCGYGNDLASDLVYNANGLLERILTGNKHSINPIKPLLGEGLETDGLPDPTEPDETLFDIDSTVQNLRYTYDNMGRLAQRTHNSQYEAFTYDNLDRLTSFVQGNGSSRPMTFTTTYDAQGNILSNTMAGTYGYESGKPHAVTEVTPSTYYPDAISPADCETDYNVFNQPSRIAEGDVEILLEYGADGQRVKAVFKNRGRTMYTRYYISANYEKEVDDTGVTTHYNYIYGATGLAAICVRQNGVDSLYYVHPDRLGSYTHITNVGKQVIRSLHFDPWGNVKNDADWSTFASATLSGTLAGSIRFLHGFTGHEHYADLKIINMKAPGEREQKQACLIFVEREVLRDEVSTYGRLYDPVIARFFSPDNFVQVPDFTQSYNRYSYCLNNPLQYVDPSGEFAWIPIVVGAAIGTVQGAIMASQNANSAGEWVGYILGGGAIGALSGFAGSAVASMGTGIGLASMTSGAISGAGFAGLSSVGKDAGQIAASVMYGAVCGAASGLVGGWTAAAIGGTAGAFVGGAVSGALGSWMHGGKGLNILYSSIAGGIGSAGAYQMSSFLGWITEGHTRLGFNVSYRQYLTMQADYQRSMFWRKEYGGYLLGDGGVKRAPFSGRGKHNVDFGSFPNNAIAEYHIHWQKPGIVYAYRDEFGNIGSYWDFPKGTVVTEQVTTRYHGLDDFATGGLPSLVLNRYDASYYNGGLIHWGWPIDYSIVRFFNFFSISW